MGLERVRAPILHDAIWRRIRNEEHKEQITKRQSAAAEDVLSSAYSTEEVVASIRADGGDPEGIGQRGVAFVKQLLDKRRRAWVDRKKPTR
mgnify:CR=1 FL=1